MKNSIFQEHVTEVTGESQTNGQGGKLETLIREIAGGAMDENKVRALLSSELEPLAQKLAELESRPNAATEFKVSLDDVEREIKGAPHKEFGNLLKYASAKNRNGHRFNIWISGPSGSGKTHAAKQVAEAMGLRFDCLSLTEGVSEVRLVGRYQPTGVGGQFEYEKPPFVDFYEHGGVYLLDEIDGADPNVVVIINAAIANGSMSLPNGETVKRHPDFVFLCCANTWGHGASREYVGRNQLDAAFLNRFSVKLFFDYDTELEATLGSERVVKWAQGLRNSIRNNGLRRIVSTRLILDTSDLIESGAADFEEVRGMFLADWSDNELTTVGETRPTPAN